MTDLFTAYGWIDPALKRTPEILFPGGVGGSWGEPAPATVTATPWLYAQSVAVNAAVTAYVNRTASAEILLKRLRRNGQYEDMPTHQALAVLSNPNPFLTRFALMEYTIGDLLLNGNAYWFLAGPTNGAPVEIWRINPQFTRIVRSQDSYISGYVTDIDGIAVPLDPAEVIHFRLSNFIAPDGLYGLSKLTTAALSAQTGLAMQRWNRSMFTQDYAVPAGIVSVPETMSDAQFDRVNTEWRESYGSQGRKTAIIRGGHITWQSVGLSQTDVDFLHGAQWSDEQVYRVFGTYHLLPAQVADDRKVNERQFLEAHAWPLLVYLAEVLSDQYFSFWGRSAGKPGYLKAEFEDIRPRERALELEEKRDQVQKMTVNEARELERLDPVDGGDDVMFVHMLSGEKLEFEREAAPPPPPQLAPFTGQAPNNDEPPAESDESEADVPEDAQERAELRESSNDDTGDEVEERFQKAVDPAALHRELAQWRRFAVNQWASPDARAFKPSALPPVLAELTQRALNSADTVDAVKAVFVQMHALVDGHLPAKGSIGVPDGTVVVYLAAVEGLLTVQQAYMQTEAPDAPIRWTPRDQLHITLVHSSLVDAAPFRDIWHDVAPVFDGLPIHVTGITTFDGSGDAVPLVALVEKTEALTALHAAIHQAFAQRGVVTSPYSMPESWQPHITVGYIDTAYAQGRTFTRSGLDVFCRAEMLSFTRGDYTNEYSRVASRPVPEMPDGMTDRVFPYGYEMETVKAIQATRLLFEGDFDDLLSAIRGSGMARRTWANRMRTLIQKYGRLAFYDGLNDGGVTITPEEPLSPEDETTVRGLIAAQSQYVTGLGEVLIGDGISDAAAGSKAALWWNKSIMPFYDAGRLSANANMPARWILNPLKKNCDTCLAANGQVHRLRQWVEANIMPQSDNLLCGGFQCGCVTQAAPGERLSPVALLKTIPTRGMSKADDVHDEGEPMAIQAPSLPTSVVHEMSRVLGRRLVDLTERPPDFILTLREDAGYYATLTDADVQQGLSLFDPRLKLQAFEVVNNTDARVTFVMQE